MENNTLARELQQKLVDCCINFFTENPNKNVDRIAFSMDYIQSSVDFGSWHPNSDSYCEIFNEHNKSISMSV